MTQINPHHQGSWSQIKAIESHPPSLSNKSKLIIISMIALLVIGILVASGLLLYFKIHSILAWSLIGGGGALAIGALIGGVVIYIRHKKSMNHNKKIVERS